MSLLIPRMLWRRMRAFAEGECNGQVILNYKKGKILNSQIIEHLALTDMECVIVADAEAVPPPPLKPPQTRTIRKGG